MQNARSHRIGVVQLAHQSFTDDRAGDFFFAAFLNRSFDPVSDRFDGIDADGTFFAGPFQAIDDLQTIVALAPSVFFDDERHHFLDSLVGGKASAAAPALAPAPDHVAVFAQARVDDAIFRLMAKGTFHSVY